MNNHGLVVAVVVLLSYVLGSIPTGYLFARARGIDIRALGSGNIGATNVSRSLGKKLGLVVLVLDALKGALPVLIVRGLGLDHSVDPFVVTGCGLAAICGHCFPVWLGFRGGKGVATSFGVFLAVDPLVIGLCVAVFAVMYALFRIASLGSLVSAVSLPVLMWAFQRSGASLTLAIASAVIVVAKHRANISRLLHGKEDRI